MAIFCHLATQLAATTEQLHGNLVLLFDLDEHTGRFGGATRYFEGPDAPSDVAGVMIGYPGMDKLVIGGRGVFRAQLHVHGVASHSGEADQALTRSTRPRTSSANSQRTHSELTTRWPAYALPAGSRLRTTLLEAAHAFGFGVTYTGLHATDERIRLDTVPPIKPSTTPPCYPCSALERIPLRIDPDQGSQGFLKVLRAFSAGSEQHRHQHR